MNVDLSGKVVVITGASRGIGYSIARRLAEEKATVVINYFNSQEAAMKLYEEIKNFNPSCMLCKADVKDEKDVKNMYLNIKKIFGKIDVLINNAGICDDALLTSMSYKKWNDTIGINLTGTYLCCKYFSRMMIKNNSGKIINIASFKGQTGSYGQCNYSASKAGIIALTKSLAKELGMFGISVNSICPGYITTDLNRGNENKHDLAKKMSVININYNMQDLLNFIVFAISDKCRGVSGRVFNIDSRIN